MVRARRTSASVILNRKALSDVGQQLAAGVGNFCASIIERAHVPDDPPIGKGLVQTGDWGVWYNGRKIGGHATKPRGLKLGAGIVGVAGYGSPIAHLLERGTVNMSARPYLMPAYLEAKGEIVTLIRDGKGGFKP